MSDLASIQEKLALIRKRQRKLRYNRKSPRGELYMKARLDGMSYKEISEMHGVTPTAVRLGCDRYRKKIEQVRPKQMLCAHCDDLGFCNLCSNDAVVWKCNQKADCKGYTEVNDG